MGTKFLSPLHLSLLTISTLCLSSCSLSVPLPPPLPILPIPTASQLRWQQSEMAMFLHFGPNTFTDSEWGTGHADPSVFAPSSLDTRQWARTAKENGFARMVLTTKHHDGFCLWPSAYTNYSVKSSPWLDGEGDVVGDLAAAAEEFGLELGLYLSPWDRHEPCYGDTQKYNEYYLGQMTELLTRYGDVKEVWLDGAKGEGAKYMDYYFDRWFKLIHQLQPNAIIFSDDGPDSRWVGDEAGFAGSTCWSLFNISDVEIGHTIEEYSEQGDPEGTDWVPAECDVSIRPGWFWHSSEKPKSATTLLEIYYRSVGRNCLLILNVPPNTTGLISDEDLQVLAEFTNIRTAIFSVNLAENATASSSSVRGNGDTRFDASNVLEESIYSYWSPKEGSPEWVLYLNLGKSISFNVLQLQEPIQMGQRVIRFHLDAIVDGEYKTVINGTTIGYKRLLRFPSVETRFVRLIIDEARADPLISFIGLFVDSYSTTNDLDEDDKRFSSKIDTVVRRRWPRQHGHFFIGRIAEM
ncbi:Alpha-L-fucosidase 1 [Rhynchospora pubera]|uniref:alpha-L-fucosidase n=1 Tax=Rhynchospora pubera TaxID=906938 RepID=A0AAV8CYW7_9POAL|nr:Alpha-L-fucosidase 1 [Rhynchospora pubera]